MDEHISSIRDALKRNETIVFAANCMVEYSGRAETHLPAGDRIIIIKSDNTLLIHQPQGSTPVNWMKETQIDIEKDGDHYVLQCKTPKEFLDIHLNSIHFVNTAKLSDGQKLQLTGHERDMADMIAADPSVIEEGLRFAGQEEQTKYGFIDVLCHDNDGELVVIECKRYKGGLAAVTQLRRYVERIKELKGIDKVRGILACPAMTGNAKKMLEDWGFEHVNIEPPKYLERFKKDQRQIGDY